MNSIDMANALINRAKNLHEYVVTTSVPEDFKFNGTIPFDLQIKEGVIEAKVLGLDFDEAVHTFDNWLNTCK